MIAAPAFTSRTLVAAAKRHHAAFSVAPEASGYAGALGPCPACFSPAESTIPEGGDR